MGTTVMVAGLTNMRRPYSIGTKIPEEWKELLEKHVVGAGKEYTTFSEYIRDLIREDLKRRGLFKQ